MTDVASPVQCATRLAQLGAASVLDACAEARLTGPAIKPLWGPVSVAGPAFAIRTGSGDNLALHRVIAEAPAGAVVVAETGGGANVAIFGDLLSRIALGRGIAGLVTDGAVRDSDRIRQLGFPVFCAGVALAAPSKRVWGTVGVAVRIGDAEIADGDWIVADGDGVVVIPAMSVTETLGRADAIRRREAELVRRAIAGESTVDQLELRPG